MNVSRVTKVVAGVCFLLTAFGVGGFQGLTLLPLGLAVWALGEAA
jgi:hypothetical protein